MEVENRNIEISLSALWKVFLKRLWILLAVGVVSFIVIFAWSHLTYVPQYRATAKIFILRQMTTNQTNNDNAYVVAEMITQDCKDLLEGRTVLQSVVDELDLKISWEKLGKSVTTDIAEGSRNLSVSVVAASPEEAVSIVNSLCAIGEETIYNVLGERHARFYEPAVPNARPCNAPSIFIHFLIALASMLLLYAVFVIIYIKNEYIGDINDIEKRLGIVILGDIPNANDNRGTHGYYYRAPQIPQNTKNTGRRNRS